MTNRKLRRLDDVTLDVDTDARVQRMHDEADADIADLDAVRVNFRWGRAQLEVLKRAAALYGVPYQTYLKMVALRAAHADIERAARSS